MSIPSSAPGTPTQRPALLKPSLLAACVLGLFAQPVLANESVFELGTVVVAGGEQSTLQDETIVTSQEMWRYDMDTVSEAMRIVPGVSTTRNSRNEEMVYVRGFDPRRVPVFLDGIPLYVPYDGYVDYGRFTTFDLSQIRVAKGAASVLYGPNTLGGAINLVSRKPTREFEGDVRLGYASGNERKGALNMGTNQGKWYLQVGASWLKADDFPLGKGFKDYRRPPTDTGNHRENAYRQDTRYSVKFGLTPNATDEYAIGYVRQEGKKGNPAYTGSLTSGGKVNRFWQWPYWDKDSVYFISSTALNPNFTVKTRLYHDKYKNGLDMFTNSNYNVLSGDRSVYNDRTYGGTVELVTTAIRNHEIHLALHYKDDKHDDTGKLFRDVTQSIALEDLISLAPQWNLRLGASYERRKAKNADIYPTGTTSGTNGLAELMFDVTPAHQFYGSIAYKTRFPTIKDRYSGRMGFAMANPDLKRETALNMEIGYRGQPWEGAALEVAVFQSNLRNEIQEAIIPDPSNVCPRGGGTCNQMQNIGKTRHRGFELQIEQQFGKQWRAGLAYTYLDRSSRSDPNLRLIDTPRNRVFAHLAWKPAAEWEVLATWEAEDGRYDSYGANNKPYIELQGYGILGLSTTWQARSDLSLQVGVSNLTDKNYELADGYPMPGRVWYANARYQF